MALYRVNIRYLNENEIVVDNQVYVKKNRLIASQKECENLRKGLMGIANQMVNNIDNLEKALQSV